MATFTVQELVNRARTYCDDDHRDQKSWITDARWLTIAVAEYQQLYRRWVRNGLVNPAAVQAYINADTKSLTGVLAIVGVGRDNGSTVEILQPAQAVLGGRNPFWRSAGEREGCSVRWTAYGEGDGVTVELDPRPSDNTGTNYIVRYIRTPDLPAALTDSIEVPFGADERLVLGIARRAKLKDSGASKLLEQLIFEADAELNFDASGRVNGPRVRNVARSSSTPHRGSWPQRYQWRFF